MAKKAESKKTEKKQAVKTPVKTPAKSAAKPAPKQTTKTESKTSAKAPAKSTAKAAPKQAAKTAAKTPAKAAAKQAAKTTVKTAAKSAAKPAPKQTAKKAAETAPKTPAKTAAKNAAKPAPKQAAKKAAETASKTPAKAPAKSGVRPEKKLYGAAAAAQKGVLFGAAKKSAEERAAKLAAGEKNGEKKSAKPAQKKAGVTAAGDGSEKKLYGAAAAAHAGVLFGAAKKSAEERAAKLAAQSRDTGKRASKSARKSGEKQAAGDGSEKKLYGAAAAAHAGVLFGAAKKSAEKHAAMMAEQDAAPGKPSKGKTSARKKENEVTEQEIEQALQDDDLDSDDGKASIAWEEDEFLFAADGDENAHEIDEVHQQRLRKKITELLGIAKKKKNVLEYNEIKDYLVDAGLDDEHFERVLEIMESEGIDVLRTDENIDDLPEDDEIIIEEEEEVDVENIDLSVPESVAIEDPVRMYLKEIGKVPLLSAEEEIALAKQMEEGIIAEKKFRDDRTKMSEDGRKNVQDRIRGYQKELKALEKKSGDSEEVLAEKERLESLIENSKKLLEQDKHKKKLTPREKAALKAPIAAGEDAKNRLAEANLRLVVSIAKRYVGRGMLFLDLIQEGNLGLIKAVEKFDFRKGFKFSTYATWWIRQAITRAIADQARTIRIPVHMVETINKLIRISRQLLQELGREPTPDEIAEKMNMPVERVREILKISQEPVSLETPIGEEEDSHLGDFIQDDHVPVPADAAAFTLLKEQLVEVLGTLTEREQKVLRLRFGLDDGRARTLEEVGREFNVTRERIRQIEAKALRKLRHPSRSRKLKDYLD